MNSKEDQKTKAEEFFITMKAIHNLERSVRKFGDYGGGKQRTIAKLRKKLWKE